MSNFEQIDQLVQTLRSEVLEENRSAVTRWEDQVRVVDEACLGAEETAAGWNQEQRGRVESHHEQLATQLDQRLDEIQALLDARVQELHGEVDGLEASALGGLEQEADRSGQQMEAMTQARLQTLVALVDESTARLRQEGERGLSLIRGEQDAAEAELGQRTLLVRESSEQTSEEHVRSLDDASGRLRELLEQTRADVVARTETWHESAIQQVAEAAQQNEGWMADVEGLLGDVEELHEQTATAFHQSLDEIAELRGRLERDLVAAIEAASADLSAEATALSEDLVGRLDTVLGELSTDLSEGARGWSSELLGQGEAAQDALRSLSASAVENLEQLGDEALGVQERALQATLGQVDALCSEGRELIQEASDGFAQRITDAANGAIADLGAQLDTSLQDLTGLEIEHRQAVGLALDLYRGNFEQLAETLGQQALDTVGDQIVEGIENKLEEYLSECILDGTPLYRYVLVAKCDIWFRAAVIEYVF